MISDLFIFYDELWPEARKKTTMRGLQPPTSTICGMIAWPAILIDLHEALSVFKPFTLGGGGTIY